MVRTQSRQCDLLERVFMAVSALARAAMPTLSQCWASEALVTCSHARLHLSAWQPLHGTLTAAAQAVVLQPVFSIAAHRLHARAANKQV